MIFTTDDSEIREIREEFADAKTQKQSIRDEGDTDMVYLLNPWNAKENAADKKLRAELQRPMIEADEISQYVNQLINGVRQNKRGIKVAAAGAGATDKTADLRQAIIRQIEYRSNAALDAYPTLMENAAQRSYGYLRIKPVWEHHKSRHQELRIVGIPNPNMVTEDPYGLTPDGSDWKFVYFAESWSQRELKQRWKNAKVQSFTTEMFRDAQDWIHGERLLVAERWRIVTKPRKLLYFDGPQGYQGPSLDVFEDEYDAAKLPPGSQHVGNRAVDYPSVQQQILNGVEILEEHDFPVTTLPFVPCYGKIVYVDTGGGPKKHILSLVRLARSAQMLYIYYRSQQAEIAGQIPKTPIGGYKGQFRGLENDWQRLPHEPMAFIEYNFTADGWPAGAGPMPPPQRIQVSQADHLQALELCAEGARRMIQAAIGASPLPTQAQRHNEKSGIALKQIEDTAQQGSFHFVDHFDFSLTRTGVVLDDWLPHYYDAAREVAIRRVDDQPAVVSINDPQNPESVSAVDGIHDVTISVGPRQISAKEAASDFADTILQSNLLQLLPPEKQAQIFAMAIRLKDVGPIGDEMADLIAPKPSADGQPSMQDLQQLQGTVQQLQQQLGQAMDYIKTEQAKQQAIIEKAHIDNAGRALVARIAADKALSSQTIEAAEERLATGLTVAHEATQNELDRQHEAALATLKAEHAATHADQAHERTLEQGDVAHARNLEAADQAHRNALVQQAAKPQPKGKP